MFHQLLANWHWKQGKFMQAAGYFESGRQWHAAAGCLETEGKPAKAAKLYQKADSLEAAARCFERIGRWAEAAQCHQKRKNLRGLARCYEYMGQWQKAGQAYERAKSLMAAARCYERAGLWRHAMACWNEMGRLDEGGRCRQVAEDVERLMALIAHRTDQIDLEAVTAHPERLLAEIRKWKDDGVVEGGLTVKDLLQSLLVVSHAERFSMIVQDGRTLLYLGLGVFAEETHVRMLTPEAQAVVQVRYPQGIPVEI